MVVCSEKECFVPTEPPSLFPSREGGALVEDRRVQSCLTTGPRWSVAGRVVLPGGGDALKDRLEVRVGVGVGDAEDAEAAHSRTLESFSSHKQTCRVFKTWQVCFLV